MLTMFNLIVCKQNIRVELLGFFFFFLTLKKKAVNSFFYKHPMKTRKKKVFSKTQTYSFAVFLKKKKSAHFLFNTFKRIQYTIFQSHEIESLVHAFWLSSLV